MRTTILIPTDFTVNSLTVVKSILAGSEAEQPLDIILLHGVSSGDSIRDLLFHSKSQQLDALVNPEFEEACEVIKNKFDSQIHSLRIDLFYGHTQSAFRNYLEGNKVQQIFITEQKPVFTSKKSFSLLPFIEKCSVPVNRIETVVNASVPEKGKIAEVFINQVSLG